MTLMIVLAVEEPFEAGPAALFLIVALGIGILLLVRSMLKHLRRVPASFDDPEPPAQTGGTSTAAPRPPDDRQVPPAN